MHLDTRIHWPRYELDLTPTAKQQPGWFNQLRARCSGWVDAWLQRQAQARDRQAHATVLCHLAPHLLNDVGCPDKLRGEVHALRRALRLAAADAHIH